MTNFNKENVNEYSTPQGAAYIERTAVSSASRSAIQRKKSEGIERDTSKTVKTSSLELQEEIDIKLPDPKSPLRDYFRTEYHTPLERARAELSKDTFASKIGQETIELEPKQ